MDYDTVSLDDEDSAVVIIDQTLLPGRTELIRLKTAEEIWNAIYLLKVRGAEPDGAGGDGKRRLSGAADRLPSEKGSRGDSG